MVQVNAEWGTCVLPTVLDNGSGMAIVGRAGLRHFRQHFRRLQFVQHLEEGPSIPVAGVSGYPSPSKQACYEQM